MRVGDYRWPPLRGQLIGDETRELEGSYRIYLAEKRMPWGWLKFR